MTSILHTSFFFFFAVNRIRRSNILFDGKHQILCKKKCFVLVFSHHHQQHHKCDKNTGEVYRKILNNMAWYRLHHFINIHNIQTIFNLSHVCIAVMHSYISIYSENPFNVNTHSTLNVYITGVWNENNFFSLE